MLLYENLSSAKKIFSSIDSPRAKWGVSLIEIISGYINTYPTYFSIRNFIEIDLDFLIKNNKIDYVEQILGASKILTDINAETYKYLSRVMIINNLYKAAEKYLTLAKDILYKDPELHYILTNYYLHNNDYTNAKKHIAECLKILPDYYPAILLYEKIMQCRIDENKTI